MEETAYLLRSRTNALDLFESIGELENDQECRKSID